MEILPKQPTVKGPAEWFTGDVHFNVVARSATARVNTVRFAPCARTAWHSHAEGQTLHVTDGIGLVQSRGGEVTVIRPGDVIWTPPERSTGPDPPLTSSWSNPPSGRATRRPGART